MMPSRFLSFRKAIATVAVAMAFFIFSCERKVIVREIPVEVPTPREAPEEEVIDHFALAESYWRQGEYDKALAAYDRYLKEFPLGDRVRDVLTRKAVIYYNRSQYEEALPLFLQVVDEYPLNEKRAEIHLLLAKTYFHLNQFSESRLSALRWLELYKEALGKEEVFFLLGQDLRELDYPPRVLYWWLKVLESPLVTKEQKEGISSQLLSLIHQATEDELKEMATYAEGSDFVSPIYYQLALWYFQSGALEEARQKARELVRLTPEEEWVTKAEELLEEIEERLKVSRNVIGCLLPLSGPFAIYGQEVLHGLELGLDIFRETDEGLLSIEFVIRDTKGDSAAAIEAIRELAEEQRA
jgi:branched-chain amino acid transport system substrate-binding protein